MEELLKLFGCIPFGFVHVFHDRFCQRVLECHKLFLIHWRVLNGVVVVDDVVKAHLEKIVVNPLCNKWFHFADFLRCLRPIKSFEQVGLTRKPVTDNILIGVVRGRKFEGVSHRVEGLLVDVFRVEPTELLLQFGTRLQVSAVQLQRCLLAHLLWRTETAGEGGGHRVTIHFGVGAHEGIDVQALRHRLCPADVVAFPEGIAHFLRHDGAVRDLAFNPSVLLDDGVHAHIGFLA